MTFSNILLAVRKLEKKYMLAKPFKAWAAFAFLILFLPIWILDFLICFPMVFFTGRVQTFFYFSFMAKVERWIGNRK